MIEPIVIKFASAGVSEVSSAFARVGAQVRKFEEQATREGARGATARVRTAQQEERDKERAYQKLVREVEKLEEKRTKDEAREAKRRESLHRRSSEAAGRYAAQQANVEIREAEKATRAIEREEQRKMRIRIRSSEMAGRIAVQQAAEEIRAAERVSKSRGSTGRRIGGMVMQSAGGVLGGALSFAGAAAGIGGGFALANAARSQISAERTASLLVNAGTNDGVAPGTAADALGAASTQSKALGIGKEDLLKSALTYSQNARGGDFQGALANMGFFGKMAQVTGADINDIAQSAGVLQSQNKDLQGPQGAAKMQQMLLNTLAQSHAGSMSMVDAAKQIGTLGSTRSFYAGDEGKTQQTLIGLGQIARVGGNTEEAGTFVKALAGETEIANKKWRKTHGTDLIKTDEHGRIASPEALIADVFRGTKGNIGEIGNLFGRRGTVLFGELEKSYIQGEKKGGVEGGVQAALANVKEVTGATMSVEDFNKQHEQSLSTPGAKIALEFNKVSELLQEKLEPRLEHFASETLPKLVPKFEKIIEAADKFVSYLADNPIKGVGAIVLTAISKDIAAAGIGAAIKALFANMGGTAGGFGGTGGKLGKVMGGVGLVGAVAAAAWGTSQVIDADVALQQQQQGNRAAGQAGGVLTAAGLIKSKRAGTLTPQQVAQAQSDAKALEARQAELQKGPQLSFGEKAANVATFGQSDLMENKRRENQRELEQTTDTLKKLRAAIEQVTVAAGNIPPVKSGAPTQPIPDRPSH